MNEILLRVSRSAVAVLSSASFLGVANTLAHGQWSVVNLHPSGATSSEATGVDAGQQVGSVQIGGGFHASLWSGSPDSWVDLDFGGDFGSRGLAVSEGQQVGIAFPGPSFNPMAALWSGSPGSWVNLNGPVGASRAHAVHAGKQVGAWHNGSGYRASMWSGTAGSRVDLHPTGSFHTSHALGVHAGQQVGYTTVFANKRAALWTGTAASWVNLHPSGATDSVANAVHDGQQVGYARIGGALHASLWAGTAASFVDLQPAVATESEVHGVHAGRQVGYVVIGGVKRASSWTGTADSWQDISLFLPGTFGDTVARAIFSDASTTYIAGYGINPSTGQSEALLWKRPVADCSGVPFCRAAPNSTGSPASITSSGSCSASANELVLLAGPVPNGLGMFFRGSDRVNGGSGLPFGDGFRCVRGTLHRLPPIVATGNLATYELNSHPLPPSSTITPGSTWHFQYWHRDPAAGGSGANLSNGLSVHFE